MYSTAYNLWTFTWFVHFNLPFSLKGIKKIHTERFSKFPSNIYSILYGRNWGGGGASPPPTCWKSKTGRQCEEFNELRKRNKITPSNMCYMYLFACPCCINLLVTLIENYSWKFLNRKTEYLNWIFSNRTWNYAARNIWSK